VFVLHSPPRETRCDMIGARAHVGSRAIRSFVDRHQPPLVLSGHIHESPRVSSSYRDAVGRTVAVNPGQFGSSRCAACGSIRAAWRRRCGTRCTDRVKAQRPRSRPRGRACRFNE
jgi:Icc-related predicted phosphoesterase